MTTTTALKQAPVEERRNQTQSSWATMSYREAASQWWSSPAPAAAERGVLNLIPTIKEATGSLAHLRSSDAALDPYGLRVWRSSKVPLPGHGNRFLNEFSIERVGEPAEEAEEAESLVMLHGYGAGLGFFYKNFEPLSRVKGWRLFALDMLGMGNSARPPFKIHAKEQAAKITEAENWFVDSLEDWRKARKLDRFTLMAHSLGGYIAVSYALKYPGRLKKLILVSPAGMPENPYAVNEALPEPTQSSLQEEFTVDQESIVHGKRNSTVSNNGSTSSKNTPKRPLPAWAVWLWDANFSPFLIMRLTGPFGLRMASGWATRRFNHLPSEESQAMTTYVFSLFRQKGSGEYVLPYLLAPGAHARSPVVNRIQNVGRGVIQQDGHGADGKKKVLVRETGIPVIMMYGENDWMDVEGGLAAEAKLNRMREKVLANATEEERRRENGSAKVLIVQNAGHHLYIDNPDDFNDLVRAELEETRDYERRMKDG